MSNQTSVIVICINFTAAGEIAELKKKVKDLEGKTEDSHKVLHCTANSLVHSIHLSCFCYKLIVMI